jgi:hypothetical protein
VYDHSIPAGGAGPTAFEPFFSQLWSGKPVVRYLDRGKDRGWLNLEVRVTSHDVLPSLVFEHNFTAIGIDRFPHPSMVRDTLLLA